MTRTEGDKDQRELTATHLGEDVFARPGAFRGNLSIQKEGWTQNENGERVYRKLFYRYHSRSTLTSPERAKIINRILSENGFIP